MGEDALRFIEESFLVVKVGQVEQFGTVSVQLYRQLGDRASWPN